MTQWNSYGMAEDTETWHRTPQQCVRTGGPDLQAQKQKAIDTPGNPEEEEETVTELRGRTSIAETERPTGKGEEYEMRQNQKTEYPRK